MRCQTSARSSRRRLPEADPGDSPRDRKGSIRADSSGSMRNTPRAVITPHLALESGKAPFPGRFPERGTEESNLALRFWRPPCYRYTSPPRRTDCRDLRRSDSRWELAPAQAPIRSRPESSHSGSDEPYIRPPRARQNTQAAPSRCRRVNGPRPSCNNAHFLCHDHALRGALASVQGRAPHETP